MTPTYHAHTNDFFLFQGDCLQLLQDLKDESFDMVFADPPYFLSNGGITFQNGHITCVDKGDWDKPTTPEEMTAFNRAWLSLCRNKLKNNGTIWVSGTYHNIFSVASCLSELDFKILNVITWQKTNPAPSITERTLTYSSELIIWARKSKRSSHRYNASLMRNINNGRQLTDVWPMPAVEKWEKSCGKHPTQKPLGLLGRIILASTSSHDWILDPFSGSGTTGIAATLLNRKFIGIEQDPSFILLTADRHTELLIPERKEELTSLLMQSIRTNFELHKIKNNLLISRIGSPEQLEWIHTGMYNIPLKDTKLLHQTADVEYILLFDKGHHDNLYLFRVNPHIRPRVMTKEEITTDAQRSQITYLPHRANSYLCFPLLKENCQKLVEGKTLDTSSFMLPFEINAPFWLKPYSILPSVIK